MPGRDIVVIGTSAGGITTLETVLSALPVHFPASIFVVMHTAQNSPGLLPSVLNRSSMIPVLNATHNAAVLPNRVYVAPPSMHMKLTRGTVTLSAGPRENRHRPSVDVLFRSAAAAYGDRVIGVVLSGFLNDGSMGLQIIKQHGGIAIVQDPEDAIAASMPTQAMERVKVDYVLPATEIGPKLCDLVGAATSRLQIAAARRPENGNGEETGVSFSCPECGGVLKEVHEGKWTRYICRVGHAYGPEALLEDQWDSVERAIWAGIRSLEEHAEFSERLVERVTSKRVVDRFHERAHLARQNARILRELLERQTGEAGDLAEEPTGT